MKYFGFNKLALYAEHLKANGHQWLRCSCTQRWPWPEEARIMVRQVLP